MPPNKPMQPPSAAAALAADGQRRSTEQRDRMHGAEIKLRFVPPSLGGRNPPSGLSGGSYRPHLRVGATGESLGVAFLLGPQNAAPDSEIDATVALIYDVDYSPLQPGAQFDVLEGATCVATGRVTRRFEDNSDWRTVGTQSA